MKPGFEESVGECTTADVKRMHDALGNTDSPTATTHQPDNIGARAVEALRTAGDGLDSF
jgi:hypothetical protein